MLNQVKKKSLLIKTLSSKGERTLKTWTFEGSGQEKKHSRWCPQPLKINPSNKNQDFGHGDWIGELYICSFVTNIRDFDQIPGNLIQISFVYIFVITNFAHFVGYLYLSFLSPKSRLLSANNISFSFKEAMATKNITSQASKNNTKCLSRRSCQVGTSLKDGCM